MSAYWTNINTKPICKAPISPSKKPESDTSNNYSFYCKSTRSKGTRLFTEINQSLLYTVVSKVLSWIQMWIKWQENSTYTFQQSPSTATHFSYQSQLLISWRWALLSADGVAPSRMVGMSVSVNLPLHHKVQKFYSGTGSPGWYWLFVCVCVCAEVSILLMQSVF